MSAKLSLGDIMATKMHASDDTIMNIIELDRNIIKYVLDILNKIFIMHMRDMESVILYMNLMLLMMLCTRAACCCHRNESFADLKEARA